MKKFKKFLAILLVASMIFTTNAVNVFAEGMNANQEEQLNEETVETSEVETLVEADDETDEELTPGSEKESEEEFIEEEEEESVGGEQSTGLFSVYGARPEDEEEEPEETTIEAKLGEPETEVKTKSKAETEVEEKLFGDPPIYTLSLKPNFPEGFSLPEGSSWYEDKSGPLDSDTDSIIIDGWNTRICVDTAGNVCNLTGYNTKADGSGTRFSYQESIFKENLEYFDLPSGSYDLVLYAMWRTSKLYTLHYNQNLPEGYSLAEGSTWGNDATLWDYEDEFVFEIYDYTGMTCEDSDGKTLELIKWNTAADGTGDDYSFGDWITSESLFTDGELTLYAVWGKVYTLSYNQNLPEGYNLSEGKIWYPDETFPNAESIYTELNGSEDMTCEDANGITRKLLKWNTKANGTGTEYNFADEIADATHFTEYKLILYAVWSEGPYMYWKVDGDGDNKTIHYYATAGEGREPVVIDTHWIEYTDLETSEKEKIKKAVIEEPIVATDVRGYFKDFSGLESITGLEKLNTSKATSFFSMFQNCKSLKGTLDVSTFDTSSLIDINGMFSDCNNITSVNFGDNFDTSNVTDMSGLFFACFMLPTITFGDKFKTNKVEAMVQMFMRCYSLTSLDLTSFDTSEVSMMDSMFRECEKLKKIYVSDGFTLRDVDSSDDMFTGSTQLEGGSGTRYSDVSEPYDCRYARIDGGETNPGFFSGPAGPYMYWIVDGAEDNRTIHYYASATDGDGRTAVDFDENGVVYTGLTEEDRKKIKTAIFEDNLDATDVRSYFKDFEGLVSITDIEKLDISNVTSLAHMFGLLKSVETLDLTSFDTSKVTDMTAMFADCVNLTTISVSKNFKVNQVTDSTNMFKTCIKIVGSKGTKYNPKSYDKTYAFIDRGTVKPGYFTGDSTSYIVVYEQKLPDGYSLSEGMTWYDYDESDDLSSSPITVQGSDDMTCKNADGYVCSLVYWTSNTAVGPYTYQFGDKYDENSENLFIDKVLVLEAVWTIPAPGPIYWIVDGEGDNKTIHYYNTDGTGRTKLEIGASGVEYKSLTKDDIKKAVIEEPIVATDARGFFQAFYELESIDNLDNLNTSNATSFAGMFKLCYKLGSQGALDLSSFDTKNLTDTSDMFESCSKLTSLTFGNNFDTSKVTNMAGMFESCTSLTSITFGSKFKTNNVTNMSDMFCAVGLEKLDLTSFDTSKVTDMNNMFVQSQQLKTIYVSDDFIVDQVANSVYMFFGCTNLVGGKGTIYGDDLGPWDKTYAHIDEGSTNPGFFTAAPTPTPPTPPTPSPTPSYGGNTGGGDSSGSSTDGPIKVTNNNMLTYTVNNIPQSLLLNDPALYLQLMTYPENTYMQKTNAKDIYGNTGFGRWMRVPNTTTWYFYAGDFNGVGNAGFLKDGWFNLGWDGVDRWYHFDANGVMQLGWYQEAGKTYFLQNDLNDNWYGKAVTGTHVIDGKTYTFDSTGALIQ